MYETAREPLSIGGVLDSGFGLFRACLSSTYALALLSALAYAPLSRAVTYVRTAVPTSDVAVGIALGFLVYVVLELIVFGALVDRIGGVAGGRPTGFGESLGVGWRRGAALFGASLCYGFCVVIGFVLLLIPGLWVSIAFLFCFYAVILDGKGAIASLRYSQDLVRGHWWRTAAIVTVIFIIFSVAYVLVGTLTGVALIFDPESLLEQAQLPWYVDFVLLPLVQAVMIPFMYSMLMAVYFDLKLRHEGGDLAARIEASSA